MNQANLRRARLMRQNRGRRRGVVALYVAGGMVLFVGAASLAVDLGHLYSRRAQAQRAADASALAGAYTLATNAGKPNAVSRADAKAREYAAMRNNGAYVDGANRARVVVQSPVDTTPGMPGGENPNQIRVTVTRREDLIFARIFGLKDALVSASSTAAYSTVPEIPVAPLDYGKNRDARITYTTYGRQAMRSNGDPISTEFLDDGSKNPLYSANGYNFSLVIPPDYETRNGTSKVLVDIFDPDCYNSGDKEDASADGVDEMREGVDGTLRPTKTKYRLWLDIDGNPNSANASSHREVAEFEIGATPDTDMKWVTPPGFEFDLNNWRSLMNPNSKFRLQVISEEGSSENGFNLRAGPPVPREIMENLPEGWPTEEQRVLYKNFNDHSQGWYGKAWNYDETAWHAIMSGAPDAVPFRYRKNGQWHEVPKVYNGTNIAAQGSLPMNFNRDIAGPAAINIGYVPPEAADNALTITKFDTDVGAKSVYYTCDTVPGKRFGGVLAGNNQSATDNIQLTAANLGAPYRGGNWTAHYEAESNDTSWWQVSYTGPGIPKGIKLVG